MYVSYGLHVSLFFLVAAVVCSVTGADDMELRNDCIYRHMLTTFTGKDDMTIENVALMLDSVAPDADDKQKNDEGDHDGHDHERRKRMIHYGAHLADPLSEICSNELESNLHECLPGSVILSHRGYNSSTNELITLEDFSKLCPALVYQLTMTPCKFHELPEQDTTIPISATNSQPYLAWVGALAAVLVISVCGLAVISLIPFLKKTVYKDALQILVALAVGTLVGDALLHLLPHALSEHEEVHTDLRSSSHHVWRASVSLFGIFIFFNAERILGVITSRKSDKKRMSMSVSQNHKSEVVSQSDVASCGSCADVTVVIGHSAKEMKEMVNVVHQELHCINHAPCNMSQDIVNIKPHNCHLDHDNNQVGDGDANTCMVTQPAVSESKIRECSHAKESTPMLPKVASNSRKHDLEELSDHEDHAHGHSHTVPGSCSAVAYMVIMGDGLHNFTDGLAIGAAFSSSFTGGLSTAIAVLCHELPHELGDFAMLLKSGMTVKQAYMCNLLSATLQCLGTVIGVLIGNLASASQWLFAFAGGIFLYVGLVDMLPEIARVDQKAVWKQLVLQNLGMLLGFSLMLVIAAFETDIENLFQSIV